MWRENFSGSRSNQKLMNSYIYMKTVSGTGILLLKYENNDEKNRCQDGWGGVGEVGQLLTRCFGVHTFVYL